MKDAPRQNLPATVRSEPGTESGEKKVPPQLSPWLPGQSGNPTGGNRTFRLARLVRERCGESGEAIVDFWWQLANGTLPAVRDEHGEEVSAAKPGEVSIEYRARANDWLADRAFGKPVAENADALWATFRAIVTAMAAVIDDEDLTPEVRDGIKQKFRDIIARY